MNKLLSKAKTISPRMLQAVENDNILEIFSEANRIIRCIGEFLQNVITVQRSKPSDALLKQRLKAKDKSIEFWKFLYEGQLKEVGLIAEQRKKDQEYYNKMNNLGRQ